MKIMHIVTLVTPDGSLGGPLRVAVNLMKESAQAGHQVLLAAGAQGWGKDLPEDYDGVPTRLFPAYSLLPGSGFAGLSSPALLTWLKKTAASADVIHIHMARDLTTLPAALIAQASGRPTVIHTHGMIDASDKLLAKPLDSLLTRRALSQAQQLIALSEQEKQDLLALGAEIDPARISLLPNGVPASQLQAKPGRKDPVEVLFLARLQERKRPASFIRMAQQLAQEFPQARFTLVGPDEGQGKLVLELLAQNSAEGRIRWEGSLPASQTLARMAQAQIYVLPAIAEPYGMTVVEAMSVGLPVVVLDDCGLAGQVKASGSGLVVSGQELGSLTQAVRLLLSDSAARVRMGQAAQAFVEDQCTMGQVGQNLERIYQKAIA